MRLSSFLLKGAVVGVIFLLTPVALRLSAGAEEAAKSDAKAEDAKKAEDKAALTPALSQREREKEAAKAAGDGELTAIAFEFGASANGQFTLAGRDARRQLALVDATYSSRRLSAI